MFCKRPDLCVCAFMGYVGLETMVGKGWLRGDIIGLGGKNYRCKLGPVHKYGSGTKILRVW